MAQHYSWLFFLFYWICEIRKFRNNCDTLWQLALNLCAQWTDKYKFSHFIVNKTMTSILIHRKFCSLDFPSVRVHGLEEISENTVKTKKPKGRAIINFFKLRSLTSGIVYRHSNQTLWVSQQYSHQETSSRTPQDGT